MALEDAIANENDLKTAIVFAREYIRDLKLAPSQLQYLCEEAIRAGCQGHRAEIFAVEVARAAAAIEGRQVTSEDLRLAVKLAIAPRGTFIQTPMDEDEMMPPPPPPPPPPPSAIRRIVAGACTRPDLGRNVDGAVKADTDMVMAKRKRNEILIMISRICSDDSGKLME
eukprot:207184_1